ncbi:PQQ-dependent sugar dehydrogenase [Alkalihalobacterium bogoriense]|uniref:PQQ-dependent sugar dehydrogenase n=1 Tax=Alkalihalobacterium bogoriense TaxID=246272 RepID=UPI00047A05B6|nr:sorbosone dehydrogenase family protein [Alkalihalobacterium bogoriense]
MKKILFVFLLTFFVTGCAEPEQQQTEESTDNIEETQEELEFNEEPIVIADNLDIPWSIEKAGDIFYITERGGHIVKVENGVTERHTVHLEQELSSMPEAGLLGFVLDPDFPNTNLAYAYYTYEKSDDPYNRIVTLRYENDQWQEEDILLDNIPSGTYHHGGRLKIGPDGYLYATTGDASVPEIAQDIDSLGGKIIRMELDGTIPEDNPFTNSYIYSFGHRNPQGLTWATDGSFYSSEHGSSANDEINEIESGLNYGWPIIQGDEEREGMVSPLFTSGNDSTWAPSGMDYYNNRLYVAALRGSAIIELNLETGEHQEIVTGLGRIRDIKIEGNTLYFISNNTDGRGNPAENDDKLYQLSLQQ